MICMPWNPYICIMDAPQVAQTIVDNHQVVHHNDELWWYQHCRTTWYVLDLPDNWLNNILSYQWMCYCKVLASWISWRSSCLQQKSPPSMLCMFSPPPTSVPIPLPLTQPPGHKFIMLTEYCKDHAVCVVHHWPHTHSSPLSYVLRFHCIFIVTGTVQEDCELDCNGEL